MSVEINYTINIHLRKFTPDDWPTYKAIRLEALLSDPNNFSSRYAVESVRPDNEWRARLERIDYWAFWGLYDGEECIGLTGAFKQDNEPNAAEFIASYIRNKYRGRGLSRLFYEARINWAKEMEFDFVEVGHRAGNKISQAANQNFGFKYIGSKAITWPDDSLDDVMLYKLML